MQHRPPLADWLIGRTGLYHQLTPARHFDPAPKNFKYAATEQRKIDTVHKTQHDKLLSANLEPQMGTQTAAAPKSKRDNEDGARSVRVSPSPRGEPLAGQETQRLII